MSLKRETWNGLLVGLLIAGLLINFRWLALPFLAVAIAVSVYPYSKVQQVAKLIAWCGVMFSMIGPVDIDPFNSRVHFGESKSGIRLVRLVNGMPKHVTLLEEYGEYFSGSCFSPTIPARWILTWNEFPNDDLTLSQIHKQINGYSD